jgi:hypothetical protein
MSDVSGGPPEAFIGVRVSLLDVVSTVTLFPSPTNGPIPVVQAICQGVGVPHTFVPGQVHCKASCIPS